MEERQNPQAKCLYYEKVSYIPYVKKFTKYPEDDCKINVLKKNHPHFSTPFIPFSTWNKPLHLFNLLHLKSESKNCESVCFLSCCLFVGPCHLSQSIVCHSRRHHLVLFLLEFHPNFDCQPKKSGLKKWVPLWAFILILHFLGCK